MHATQVRCPVLFKGLKKDQLLNEKYTETRLVPGTEVLSAYKIFVSVYLNATYILSDTEGSLVLCVVKLNVYDTFKITYSAFNLFSAAL